MTICSLIIQTKPEYSDTVHHALNHINGVEIHAQNKQGKMIISIDHPDREYCSKIMTDMTHIPGVMSTSLVYEYQEDLDQETMTRLTTTHNSRQGNTPSKGKMPITEGYTI